jgi:2-hydroxychromene-2-carboxylate isomerase
VVAAAYSSEWYAQLSRIRRVAEAAGVRGVPSLLTDEGETHWGMGGLERLLAGEPLVPRAD